MSDNNFSSERVASVLGLSVGNLILGIIYWFLGLLIQIGALLVGSSVGGYVGKVINWEFLTSFISGIVTTVVVLISAYFLLKILFIYNRTCLEHIIQNKTLQKIISWIIVILFGLVIIESILRTEMSFHI